MRSPLLDGLQPATVFDAVWPMAVGVLVTMAALRWRWRVPPVVYDMPYPFERWSVRFRRRLNKPLLPDIKFPWLRHTRPRLRGLERRGNRLLQGPTVNRSAALMIVFILLAATLILI